MKTQRELLEKAAKAAGLNISWREDDGGEWFSVVHTGLPPYNKRWSDAELWNPLDSDSDALRLAVKLRLDINHNNPCDQDCYVSADRMGVDGCFAPVSCIEDVDGEAYRAVATRLAITRAAAAIWDARASWEAG